MYGKLDFLHAAFGIVPNNLNNYESTIDSPAFDVKNANSSFLLNLFLRKNFYLYYGERANGSRKARRIHEKDFLMMPIKIPSIQEQNQIVFLIKIINKSITLQQRKLKQLDLLKKAMLQQILTTNDYPKIRFRGFTNVWDQRRLEKIAKITTGKLDANAMVKNGKYDFYTSGIKKFKINTAAFEGPAITIAGNGATVGYMHLADGKFNAYQRTYVLNQFTVNRLFLFYSVKKVLPRSIYQSARTGNIPYIVLNMITDLKVNVPKEKEQKKIGELFTEIQAILINQKNRLRCIKDLKQYLLQNIFL
ncbi:restriction endonuclease subunit S [Lactobacillus johnsonii]|uniref:restriction endonuclease subunit S n=1 Tax=Lactobacillus johnsonii TaxID=33959 RepID=UPI0036686122